jgi:hypothetical protein
MGEHSSLFNSNRCLIGTSGLSWTARISQIAVDNDLASGVISCPLSAEMTPDPKTQSEFACPKDANRHSLAG